MHSLTLMCPSGWIDCTGHSLAQRWQGVPHSGQRRSHSNIRMRPGNRERGAERAHVAAEEAFDEQSGRQAASGVQDERPFARELQDDCGLERLDLGQLLGERGRVERQAEQAEKDDVLDRPQPLVKAPGNVYCGIFTAWRSC